MTNNEYKVIITGDAQLNFESIEHYLIAHNNFKDTAINKVVKLVKQVKKLSSLPSRYQSIEDRYNIAINNSYRVMPIGNYLALYKIDYQSNVVYILRIISQEQNIREYILDNLFK